MVEANEWAWEIADAADALAKSLQRNKGHIEQVLGLTVGALSAERLRGPKGKGAASRVAYRLAHGGTLRLAIDLGVGEKAVGPILAFRDTVMELVFGDRTRSGLKQLSPEEAVERGWAGVELFACGAWDASVSFLKPAWHSFYKHLRSLDEGQRFAMLRVGTELSGWLLYQGEAPQADAMARVLWEVGRSLRSDTPDVLRGVALMLNGTAMARRAVRDQPYRIVAQDRDAARRLQSVGDIAGYVRATRDQAKPLLAWGLGWQGGSQFPGRVREAEDTLLVAERAAGGSAPPDPLREEWLFTRMTRVEVLSVIGRPEDAKRVWDDTMGRGWVAGRLGAPNDKPLTSKARVSEMVLLAGAGEYDALAEKAGTFIRDPANAPYVDRLHTVASLRDAAVAGDAEKIRDVILA